VGQSLVSAVPEPLRDQVSEVVESFTTALGGKPIPGWTSDGHPHPQT
jgi:hypothetical protein